MGLDRLTRVVVLSAAVALLATGCDHGERPRQLLDGRAAGELRPVARSVVTAVHVVRAGSLGRRVASCARLPVGTLVVERIGVFSQSLSFRDRAGRHLHSCDGGEHAPPWCGRSVGLLDEGRLLDPRLDLLCRDAEGRRLAYVWVEPAKAARWIGVDQGSYIELYEQAAGLPVRVATRRGIDQDASSATFELRQYGARGEELLRSKLEVAVAG